MKTMLLPLLLLLTMPSLSAQCERLIELGQAALDEKHYQLAIERLLDADDNCPAYQARIRALIQQTFAQIEAEKQVAESELVHAETQRQRAAAHLDLIEREKQRADSALALSQQVLDQMYFYGGKFGLTVKDLNESSGYLPYIRFGFIDPQGREVLPFDYLEATPFSQEDGFSRVLVSVSDFEAPANMLLDTNGILHSYARNLDELGPEKEILNTSTRADVRFPRDITRYQHLKGIYVAEGYTLNLPLKIGKLDQLETFQVRVHTLKIPVTFSLLTQLKVLSIQCRSFPGDTYLLDHLGEFRQLQRLELNYYDLFTLPESIGQLRQLKRLSIDGSRITDLPSSLGKLTQLEHLYLNLDAATPENLARLREWLPDCTVHY